MSRFNRKLFLRDEPLVTTKRPFILSLIFYVRNIRLPLFACLDNIWWNYVPGTIITVPFPNATLVDEYRETLENLCGCQFVGWHWKSANAIDIQIKFRYGKTKYATMLALKWS